MDSFFANWSLDGGKGGPSVEFKRQRRRAAFGHTPAEQAKWRAAQAAKQAETEAVQQADEN